MTDFIHEHPKDEKTAPTPPPAPAEGPELDEKAGQKRVYGYIFILFVVSLSLLLWAFFMNQRSTNEALSELRGNAGTLQSTLDRNVALEQQNEALEAQIRTLNEEKAALASEKTEAAKQYEQLVGQLNLRREEEDAAITVYSAALKASEEEYRAAAEILAGWDTALLKDCIARYDATEEHYAGETGQSEPIGPRYDALVEQLTALGYLTTGEKGQLTVSEPAA